MNKVKFIYIDNDEGNSTKEIKQLLDKGLIKYVDGENYGETDFVYLAKNEDIIKNVIKTDYNISDILKEISMMFEQKYMTITNDWEQEVYMSFDRIFSLIENDLNNYIPENKQKEIFNAKNPSEKINEIINEIGRNQIRIWIESFIIDIDKIKFS